MNERRSSRRLQEEGGSILIEALIVVALILMTAISLAQILPLQFSFQRNAEDRAKVEDRQDTLISFANTWLAPAELPLDDVDGPANDQAGFSVTYRAPTNAGAAAPGPALCYRLALDRATDEVTLRWKDTDANGLCSGDFSAATTRLIAENVVNTDSRPFLIYYNDDTSDPIASPATAVSSCNLRAPAAAPAGSAGVAGQPNGTYVYAISFVRSEGESALGPASASVTATNQQVDLTGIPVGPQDTTARRVYRSPAAANPRTWRLAVALAGNTATTATDDVSNAAIATNAEPAPAAIAAGRCAKSIVLQIDVDDPSDRVFFDTRRYRILLSNAVTTAQLGNSSVTGNASPPNPPANDKFEAGPLTIDRIADDSLDPSALAGGLSHQYEQLSLTNSNDANYGPLASGEVDQWRYNETSPAVGGLRTGDAERAALLIDWGSYCRAGMRLEARGRYTVYSPSALVSVSARMLSFAGGAPDGIDPSLGGSFASAAAVSVGAGTYKTLVSDWNIIGLGRCNEGNYLLESDYFLYLLQTKATAQQPYAVTNALLELRWTPQADPAGNVAPYAPQQLSPAADAEVASGPGAANYLNLYARFLDPDVLDRGRLDFELCSDSTCSAQIASGTTRSSLNNGGRGRWVYFQPLAAGQLYYWRARGEDLNGNIGPWSPIARIRAAG